MHIRLITALFFLTMTTWFGTLGRRVISFFVLAVISCTLMATVADAQTTKTVTPGKDSSYFFPSVNVEYDDPLFGSVSKQLVHGECSFMDRYVTRVCARIALPKAEFFPGDKGYDPENPNVNKPADNYGNRTGIEGNPRIQICAYEDPCDGNDPPGGKCFSNLTSPYHHKTSAQTVMSRGQLVGFTAVVSGWIGGLGVILAPGIHAILATYNHIVTKNLGCVDIPLAPLPPEWCHSCWEVAYSPNPEIKINSDATFFDPKTNVRICVNKDDESHLEDCRSPDAKTLEEFVLTPDHTTKIIRNDLPVFEECKVETKAKLGRQFCARISTMRPKYVCVYKKSGNSKDILVSCVDRPEWMPKPTLGEITNMYMGPKMSVTYPDNGTIELQEDPFLFDGDPGTTANLGWNKHCSYLEQQKFCLYRPCQTFTENGECEQIEEDTMCVSGYESPYGVVVSTADGSVIPGLPNKQEPTLNNAWVYKPPFCWQRDKISGRCLNYDDRPNGGVCCDIINNTSDPNSINKTDLCPGIKGPYKNAEGQCVEYIRNVAPEDPTQQPDIYMINDDPINPLCDTDINKVVDKEKECRPVHTLRPLSDKEAGMCNMVPPNPDTLIKNGRATGVYVVGKNCGRVSIRMWGGGGAGHARAGGSYPDQAGGSGAYAQLELQVSEGTKINYIAGRGSQRVVDSNLHAGEASSIFHIYNGVEEKISVGAGALAGRGMVDISTWKWNGVPCNTKDPNASCYIHSKTRNGFSGGKSGSGMRGPGGGNAPDFCFKGKNLLSEQVICGISVCPSGTMVSISHYRGPRPGLCSTSGDIIVPADVSPKINLSNPLAATKYIGCIYHGVRAPLSSEEAPLPEEPDVSVDPLDWPFKWPGAGGCSYDDPYNEPWGEGSHGRIEIMCIGGIGAAGNQEPCPATANVYTKRFDPIKEAFNHELCQLPQTQHGFNAPSDACTAVAPNNPLQVWIEREFSGAPRCNNGKWTY